MIKIFFDEFFQNSLRFFSRNMNRLTFVSLIYIIVVNKNSAWFNDGDDSCNVPPSLWCDDPQIAKQCGVLDSCINYNKTAFGQKIKVTLLYETLCPDCQEFIANVLYPQVFKYAQDFVQLELVPYGNARRSRLPNGTYEIVCQHGSIECKLNKLHSCVINQLNDVGAWFPFVYCMETALQAHTDPEKAAAMCYKKLKVKQTDQDAIAQCRNGSLGDQLQSKMAKKTEGIQPQKHNAVPWILINDVSTANLQMYQNDLLEFLCSWYRGSKQPGGCDFLRQIKYLRNSDNNV